MKRIFFITWAILYALMAYSTDRTITLNQGEATFEVTQRSFTGFSFTVNVPEIRFSETAAEGDDYTRLHVPGFIKDFSLAGNPDLPVISRLIEVPEGASVSVEIVEQQKNVYSLGSQGFSAPVFPAQPSVSKSLAPEDVLFVKNEEAYQSDRYNEQKLVRVEMIGKMRGVRVARVICSPFRYNPVQNKLEVSRTIKVKVSFPGADRNAAKDIRDRYYSPVFGKTFNALANHGPESVNDSASMLPIKMVIVSDPMFQNALQPFIAWKRKKGYVVIEAYTNDPQVGSTTTSIKNYLQGLYNAATAMDPAPSYALLVGDVNQIPSFSGTTGSHPSDLYYFEYDGSGDYLPELFYGRFSANNLSELQPQLDKTLEYEQYQMPSTAFLSEVVMVAGMDNSYAATHGNGQINYGASYYFNAAHNMTSHTYLYPASGSSASQIKGKISDGVGFANYTAHCGTNGWSDPSFSISDISALQNTSEYPLIIGNCCLSNKFDGTCFGEALLRASGKGALGYIGGSNSTLWDEDYYWSVGVGTPTATPTYAGTSLGAYDRIFHDHGEPYSEWYETNGQIIAAGNLAVSASTSNQDKYYWEIYHLMGDPTVMTYYGIPSALTISHPQAIPVGLTSINISTEPYTYIGITRSGILHGAGTADSLGNLNLNILPIVTPGHVSIIGSKLNREPYIDSILVIVPSGAYVGMKSVATVDNPGGNNDGKVDFGESILLDLELENFGNLDANQVTALISSMDSHVSITDSVEVINLIQAGDTSTVNSAFAFDVAAFIPDQHTVKFSLQLTDTSGGIWSYDFNILLNSPKVSIASMDIDDQVLGNGNGSVDPGETLQVIATIKNEGHSIAANTTATLTTYSPLATINVGSGGMGTLLPGGQGVVTFEVDISSTAAAGDMIEMHCHSWSGLYQDQDFFAPVVGQMVEDWESGDFSMFAWVPGGTQPWTVSNSGAYEGTFCAASGNIGNANSSELEVDVNVLMNDSISFYRKVSSEDGYDYLIFSIDGIPVGEWSGIDGWAQFAYPVTPGQHTFKWSYEKDWWVSSGSDMAWIDYIEFPAVAGIATDIEEKLPGASLDVFPNPGRAEVRVNYFLPGGDHVRLMLFDGSGRLVSSLIDGNMGMGHHSVMLPGDVEGGIYHLIFEAGEYRLNRKVVLID